MNSLREGIIDYLELRRSLGFKLKKDKRLLLDFAEFMARRGATWITSKLALAWAAGLKRSSRIAANSRPFVWTADPTRVLAAIARGEQALESVHQEHGPLLIRS